MSDTFRWNPYADQPHNIAPRKERFFHHFKHAESYVSLVFSNLRKAAPILAQYREYRKKMYEFPSKIGDPFALSVSLSSERNEEVIEHLKETGVNMTLVRVPSWERENLDLYKKFFDLFIENGIELTVALLQQRDDVLNPSRWESFLEEVFSRFASVVSFFEVGHAWNRTKWGVWDYREYLELVRPAVALAEKYKTKLVGPAVIDFEFHLYPPVLDKFPFDKVSSLFYVDRVGAPENTQFGWDTSRKLALLKAVVDGCCDRERDLWITEVNWPLKGTGKYSPASGKPNVSEEEQADYLVRYYILCLASGLVERVYWWQLVAPGYGLIDSHKKDWRKRSSFYAMKTMVAHLAGSTFTRKMQHLQAEIYLFRKGKEHFAACWITKKWGQSLITFPMRIIRVVDRNGKEIPFRDNRIEVDGSPKYIFFEKHR